MGSPAAAEAVAPKKGGGLQRSKTYQDAAALLAELNNSYSASPNGLSCGDSRAQLMSSGGASGGRDTWNGRHSFSYLKKQTGLGGGLKHDTPAISWDDPASAQQELYAPTPTKPANRWQF